MIEEETSSLSPASSLNAADCVQAQRSCSSWRHNGSSCRDPLPQHSSAAARWPGAPGGDTQDSPIQASLQRSIFAEQPAGKPRYVIGSASACTYAAMQEGSDGSGDSAPCLSHGGPRQLATSSAGEPQTGKLATPMLQPLQQYRPPLRCGAAVADGRSGCARFGRLNSDGSDAVTSCRLQEQQQQQQQLACSPVHAHARTLGATGKGRRGDRPSAFPRSKGNSWDSSDDMELVRFCSTCTENPDLS